MKANITQRREFLKRARLDGIGSDDGAGLPEGAMAFGGWSGEHCGRCCEARAGRRGAKYHIKFAVCGMSHDHIFGMIGAVSAAAANWWRRGAARTIR